MTPEQLAKLHNLLGHLTRQLWDLQAQRIAAGNRVGAMERDGCEPDDLADAAAIVAGLRGVEALIEAQIRHAIRRHPLAPWITAQRGIGLATFANLLGVAGDIGKFPTVSKLWKYLGLHVVAGAAPKKVKGQAWTHTDCQPADGTHANPHLTTCPATCTTNHHPHCVYGVPGTAYSPKGRTVCYLLGEAIVKVGGDGPYRAAYDAKKAYYLVDRARSGPSDCPFGQTHKLSNGKVLACVKRGEDGETSLHVHRAAMRYAVKAVIKALWIEWHHHFDTGRIEAWEERERERAASLEVMPKERVPPVPEARYDYALPGGAR